MSISIAARSIVLILGLDLKMLGIEVRTSDHSVQGGCRGEAWCAKVLKGVQFRRSPIQWSDSRGVAKCVGVDGKRPGPLWGPAQRPVGFGPAPARQFGKDINTALESPMTTLILDDLGFDKAILRRRISRQIRIAKGEYWEEDEPR